MKSCIGLPCVDKLDKWGYYLWLGVSRVLCKSFFSMSYHSVS